MVTENGKPAVEFDGTSSTMSAPASLTNAVTIFVVYRRETTTGNYILDGQSSTRLAVGGVTAGNQFQVYVSSGLGGLNDILSQQNLGYVLANATNSAVALNGGTATTGSSGNAVNTSYIWIGSRLGGSGFMQGKQQEVIYFDADESANRPSIEENIGGYYDIPLAGLLDENPGAAAAYSLRRLSSTYTGSAVQVQRADNVGGTTNIGFDSYGDLDTTALTTAAAGNSMVVATWYDQSGNGRDATQGTSSARPKIYDATTGVVVENGKAAVEFDGLTSTMLTGITPAIAYPSSEENTTIAVRNNLNANAFIGDNDPQQNYRLTPNRYGLGGEGNGLSFSYTSNVQELAFAYGNRASSIAAVYRNGRFLASRTTLNPHSSSTETTYLGSFAGSRVFWSGKAQEIIIYPSDQSANRPSIEDNVGGYYGIEIAGLLDQYSGAEAGYSLRKLSNSYTGFAVKVQDNVGGATQDIGFNADGELDTVALLAYAGSNDVFVETWYDQSGNVVNATQPSSGLRPQIVSSGVVIVDANGSPAMDFTGTQELKSTQIVEIEQPSTAISVVDTTGRTSQAGWVYSLGLTDYAAIQDDGSTMRMYAGSFVIGTSGTNTRRLDFSLFDGANSEIWFNGSSILTGNPGTNGISGIRIGGLNNANFQGYFSEFIAYSSDQSDYRTGIEANINFFYNIY